MSGAKKIHLYVCPLVRLHLSESVYVVVPRVASFPIVLQTASGGRHGSGVVHVHGTRNNIPSSVTDSAGM
jgi:hypothetical protein